MNTKRTAVVFLCACMAFAFVAGCKKLTPNNQHVTTLQGTIYNAITGERIGGKDLKMYLEQGTLTRTPDLFYTGEKIGRRGDNTTIDLMGDYAFANIPSADILLEGGGQDNFIGNDIHPNEYRITVIKDGFQRFEGVIGYFALSGRDNVIKNIYLFPVDYLIPCYNFTAKYNGKPVPGLTISAAPYALLSPGIIATDKWMSALLTDNYFFPAPGNLASIPLVTDANGKVSFCKLATGAAYIVSTNNIQFENVDLLPQFKILVAGYSDTDQVFNLRDSVATGNEYGLYVTSASNTVDGQVDATGTLTIIFNRPVTLTGKFGATTNSVAGVLDAVDPVTATLSADGLSLTLVPKWTVEPGAAETNIFVYYNNGIAPTNAFFSIQGYPGSEVQLFNCVGPDYVEDSSGYCIDGTVQIRN